jgi:phospholipase/carboxylesterase
MNGAGISRTPRFTCGRRLLARSQPGAQGASDSWLVVMGFSQGACLTLEFAARHARRYAAVVAFTGG